MHGGRREEGQGMKETVEEKGEETVFGLGFGVGDFGFCFVCMVFLCLFFVHLFLVCLVLFLFALGFLLGFFCF